MKEIGRDEFVITSKAKDAHLRYDELQRACLASALRLGVKEIDLFQVHWPDPWEQISLSQHPAHQRGAKRVRYGSQGSEDRLFPVRYHL